MNMIVRPVTKVQSIKVCSQGRYYHKHIKKYMEI